MSPYILLLNNFWEIHSSRRFAPAEVAIYTYILSRANAGRWGSLVVPAADEELLLIFGFGRASLRSSRERLIEEQLLAFTPGNGRGNPAKYLIIEPEKVIRKRTLSAGDNVPKGVSETTPLQPATAPESPADNVRKGVSETTPLTPEIKQPSNERPPAKGVSETTPFPEAKKVKAAKKVYQKRHLSALITALGAEQRPPKILIYLPRTNVLGGVNAGARKFSFLFLGAKKGKAIKKKTELGELLENCLALYDKFHRDRTQTPEDPTGLPAFIDGAGVNALKGILAYMRTVVRDRAEKRNEQPLTQEAEDLRVLDTWRILLENSSLLEGWLASKIRLLDIRSNISNLLHAVRNAITKQREELARAQQQQQPGPGAGNPSRNAGRGGSVSDLQSLKTGGGARPADGDFGSAPGEIHPL